MMRRDEKIYQEAAALWMQIHGEPPPAGADGAELVARLLGAMPEADYDRLSTPYLRPANIAFPKHA